MFPHTETEWDEILDLKEKIREAVFKTEEISYKTEKVQRKNPKPFRVVTKFRILQENGKTRFQEFIDSLDKSSKDIGELYEVTEDFLTRLPELIWNHRHSKALIEDMKKDSLEATERLLRSLGYKDPKSEKAIKSAISILEKDLDRRLEKFRKTRDCKYFEQTSGHDRIYRENETIRKIVALYNKTYERCQEIDPKRKRAWKPLSARKILGNLAIVFSVIDFWKDSQSEKIIFERLRDRMKPRALP